MKYLPTLTVLICTQMALLAIGQTAPETCKPGTACEFQQACFTEPCPTVPGICSKEGICTLAQ